MSAISVDVGNTGWTRAWICDRCGFRVERTLTGKRVSTDDIAHPETRLEYDDERFTELGHPFADWVVVEKIYERIVGGPGLPRLHLCPKCAGPLLDHLLEQCTAPKETTEEAKGVVELPYDAPRSAPVARALERLYGTQTLHNSPAQNEATGHQVPSEDDGLPR